MRLVWCLPLLAATFVAACKSGDRQQNPTTNDAPSTGATTSATTVDRSPPKEKPKPVTLVGGTIGRTPAGDALYVADEDRGLIHKVALPVDVTNPPLKISVPGQPAEVLVLGDKVLVTIRSEGATIPAADPSTSNDSPEPLASASAKAPAPEAKTKPIAPATGPGLLLVMKHDPDKGLVIASRIELPEDAWGVSVTPDESLALEIGRAS